VTPMDLLAIAAVVAGVLMASAVWGPKARG
jgi:hypothetical protein